MKDTSCVEFLQWALPHLRMQWPGFRRVRRQVCKRIDRRLTELGLEGLDAYRRLLAANPEEWEVLDGLCRITISRFYRDRTVFETLGREVCPALAEGVIARGASELRCWSAGCGSGEEPYTVLLLWAFSLRPRFPSLAIHVLATDIDAGLLRRAERARYMTSSLKDLPRDWQGAFDRVDGEYCLRPELRGGVEFLQLDIRREMPPGPFHLLLCRNLVFTYFERDLQRELLSRLLRVLLPGGALVIGRHEALPTGAFGLAPWPAARGIFRKITDDLEQPPVIQTPCRGPD